ncbi:multicopper oxidase-domain-containing protein [Obelidium mucronatum]|nr:multicopper oxidase-domain-containing protein [Obelidium mucronatum]
MSTFFIGCLFATATAVAALDPPNLKRFTFNISEGAVAPDGVPLPMKLVNNQLDYPIIVDRGDTVSITINNNLKESTSIHWHGLDMRGTPWYDGAEMVSQCPIQPGSSFVYEFNVGNQTGTYWYHSHSHLQSATGLKGPFIIRDPNEPAHIQYDDEFIMTITDHFHIAPDLLLANYYGARDPAPSSALINGLGRSDCRNAQAGGIEDYCVLDNPWTVFPVTKGKRYLVRVINTSAEAGFTVKIDHHDMTIISADGHYTTPTNVNEFQITAGQRYSFLFVATGSETDNYWITATMEDMYTSSGSKFAPEFSSTTRAILRYQSAPLTEPPLLSSSPSSSSPSSSSSQRLNVFQLGQLNGTPTDKMPSFARQMRLRFAVSGKAAIQNKTVGTMKLDINGDPAFEGQYHTPRTPTLKDVVTVGRDLSGGKSNSVNVVNGESVLLIVENDDVIDHTFHLHGHSFLVINGGNTKEKERRQDTTTRSATFPRRDSIQVPGCVGTGEGACSPGFVSLLIHFDNPGVWLFHCHIDWHLAAGLVISFVNTNFGDVGKGIPPDFWTC